jgi:hypothetical protein
MTTNTVDAADRALIPTPSGFVASLFLGTGKYAKKEAANADRRAPRGEHPGGRPRQWP